ncbi:MAG: hypothetical protein AUK47_18485 [Deltaproteobacteria bacterium CG2_30_63_29]|nr:MAG: hypothetical protein AUK47_18485 [Deltaproteobacteria bacterium CG2_30_63_29]
MARTSNFSKWLVVSTTLMTFWACTQPQPVTSQVQSTEDTSKPTLPEVAASVDVDPEPGETELASVIKTVTVYSDRALVTRQASAQVSTEPTVFAFKRLPGWVDDGSVRVAVSAGRIVDVRVQRTFLARATDKTYKAAEEHHQDLSNQLAALDDELQILAAQQAQIESIRAFSLEKLTAETSYGTLSVKDYGSVVEFITGSLRATADAKRAAVLTRSQILPEFEASQRTLDELQSLMSLEETTVLVTLLGTEEETSTLNLTYMMPGATWEPLHELRAQTTDSKSVEVVSYAVVTQTTGEDWDAAELSFSTQSSTESVRIPELEALTLGDTQNSSRTQTTRVSSFTRAELAYEGQNQLWNKVHQKSQSESENFEQVYQSNMELLQVVQDRTVQLFQTLQLRGTTAHFKAVAIKSVRGDGHPVQLRIGETTLQSVQKIVAVPEQSLNAARTLEMTNSSDKPFLPGRVALYQDGAFLGMTDIDFIAAGENFALFLSVADHLKLSRTLDRKSSSLVRKKFNRMQVSFIVSAENLSDAATSFTLADRIPVSENKDIMVSNVVITPAESPDSKGLLVWDLTLQPKESRTFKVSYVVEYPPTLVLETQRRRDAEAPYPSSSTPARSKSRQIEDQLMDLEQML